jgi:hypothetical protein
VIATLAVALPLAALIVHFTLVPLPVLRLWLRPAHIVLNSHPPGASVYLDGRKLGAQTPTQVEVERDRDVHLVEMKKEGFHSTQRQIRFDRTLAIELSVTLAPVSRPGFEPIPTNNPAVDSASTPAAPPTGTPSPPQDRPDELAGPERLR